MKRRIFLNMILLTVVSLLAISSALCLIFYGQFSKNVQDELAERGRPFRNVDADVVRQKFTFEPFEPYDLRITLINPDGTVEYDNTAVAADMENHNNREEVAAALESGYGGGRRFSDTLSQETFYYAVKLSDGYVLRFAKTTRSVLGMFTGVFPAVMLTVAITGIICYLAAGSFTGRIVEPLGGIDLNGELTAPYDELAPFIKKIAEQRERIDKQLYDLQIRSDTISAIMNNMNEGIILINAHGVILSVNESVSRLFEKDTPVEGKNIPEILRDVNFSERVRDALSGMRTEMVMELGGGTYRVYFSHVKGGGAIILFLDITEKSESEKLRREFSANVSHELKTPLTSIYAGAEMLYNGMVKENDRLTFYEKMKNEAGRLIALIEDILMISKLDESGGQESFEDITPKAIAAEAVESLSQKAAESSVTIKVTGENATLKASRSLIYEMFYNLIDNAIKYNKPDGIVNVDIATTENRLRITVADTGIGIPRESQSRVFERFYRVDKSRSKKTGGTGLGLAIVKHIVLVHNGEIKLHSRENEGTAITITLSES